MVVNKNYNNGIVSSISLISNDLKIDIYNAGSDLYWVLDKYKDDNEIKVCNDCEFYNRLDRLFNDIKECDNQYDRCLIDDQFVWYSEAYGLKEEAHKLIITKNEDLFSIKFDFNSNSKLFNISGNCPVCFCLSGSRNQRIANLFSEMFLEYQYNDYKTYVKK